MSQIPANLEQAIKVRFVKPIFEGDFPETGMIAWLTHIEWDEGTSCYKLYFDFTEFEAENDKYFRCVYYKNKHTAKIDPEGHREFYTAKEAGMYQPKYSVYFSPRNSEGSFAEERCDADFEIDICNYLKKI